MILSGYVNVRKKKEEEKTIHISGQPFDTGRTQIDPDRQTDRQTDRQDREFECDCELGP